MAIGTAAAILGSAVIGGVVQSRGASKAASAQTSAARDSIAAQERQAALARQAQQEGTSQAVNALNQGRQNASQQLFKGASAGQAGYDQARGDINQNARYAIDALQGGRDTQVNAANIAYAQQRNALNPIVERGDTASGAYDYNLGIGDKPAGYGGYENTAYQNYVMDQTQRGVDGSAASQGGLFSGATIKAQQANASGLAGQFYGDYMNRLSGVSSSGNQARGALADYAGQRGNSVSNAYGGAAANIASIRNGVGTQQANISMNSGNALAQMYGNQANLLSNNAGSIANAYTGQGSALANNFMGVGDAQANAFGAIGNAQAAGAIGSANAINGTIGNSLGAWQYNQQTKQAATPYGQAGMGSYSGGVY